MLLCKIWKAVSLIGTDVEATFSSVAELPEVSLFSHYFCERQEAWVVRPFCWFRLQVVQCDSILRKWQLLYSGSFQTVAAVL